MKLSEQVGDVVGLCVMVAVSTVSTFNWQFLCTPQRMVERINTTDWLKVISVTGVQGYQAPV